MPSSGLTEKDQLALKKFKEAVTNAVDISPKVIGKEDYRRLYEKRYPFVKNVIRDGIAI